MGHFEVVIPTEQNITKLSFSKASLFSTKHPFVTLKFIDLNKCKHFGRLDSVKMSSVIDIEMDHDCRKFE